MVLYYVPSNLCMSNLGSLNVWWLFLLTFIHCSFLLYSWVLFDCEAITWYYCMGVLPKLRTYSTKRICICCWWLMATTKLSPLLPTFNVAVYSPLLVGWIESGIDMYTTWCVKWMASGRLQRDLSLVLYDEGGDICILIADVPWNRK